MSEIGPPGSIVWQDLTVGDAAALADFYTAVVGWEAQADENEGGDFHIRIPGQAKPVAGICYARGVNANLPPHWLVYVSVEDLAESAARCAELGGQVVDGPRLVGAEEFCVIQDPAGAYLALIGPGPEAA